jgi:branched-chain amino acid transport system substrate-binding protein
MDNNKKGKVRFTNVLVLVLVIMFVFCGYAKADTATKVLKIGSSMALSGPLGTIGLAWTRGFNICCDVFNDKGGLTIGKEKYQVQMINEDGKGNAEGCAAATAKLIDQDGVKFVIGSITDPEGQAIYKVTAPAKALHIVSWLNTPGGPVDVSPQRPLKVRNTIHNYMVHPILYDYLVKNYPNVKTVVYAELNIGIEHVVANRKAVAEKHGLKPLATEFYPFESFDFYPLYTKLLSHHPDAIDIGSSTPDHASMHVKVARQMGFKGPIFHDSPPDPAIILNAAGAEACEDVFGCGVDIRSSGVTAEMRKVEKGWKAKYSEDFISDAFPAFDVTWVLFQAMEKAQSVDPEVVLKTLEKMTKPGSLQTVYGPAYMGGLKTYGVNRVLVRPVPISRIKNGKTELVSLTMPQLP